ncbi:hypothetical protein [Actinomadura oligospora]|nr:hypothetical protein [Actinomadura oligospora]
MPVAPGAGGLAEVGRRTADSPYAYAFLTLLARLGVIKGEFL